MIDVVKILKKSFPEHLFKYKKSKLSIDLVDTNIQVRNLEEVSKEELILIIKEYLIYREHMRKIL